VSANKRFKTALCLLAGVFCAGQSIALGQASGAAGTQAPGGQRTPNREYLRGPAQRELLYVTLPGSLERPVDNNGNGIVVLDAKNGYNFVKRIQTWDVPASQNALQVAGVAASPVTQLIYVASRGRLAAVDLTTDKRVWDNAYDGQCCERPQVSPDGKFLYVGSDLKDFWYVLDAKTGALITKIMTPLSAGSHNLNLSQDGKLIFMSPSLHKVLSIADANTNSVIKTIEFGDNTRVFVINHDASLIYSNTNNLLGFEIADVKTGKVIQHVEVEGFGWREKWNVSPRPRVPYGCPSHGIALTPDEKEIWLADGINNYIHIFDNTVMPPKQMDSIKTTAGPYWITVGLDGKLAYVSSGEIIDMKTRKIVGQMKDEYGRTMYSEKLLHMVFENGKLMRVANQFGNGLSPVETTTASARP
jgi:DNA-binding beta-propeller fold protein YncE